MSLDIGNTIGTWIVEEAIGRGGMATVYRVRHSELGTVHALKVLDRTGDENETRLLAEGRAQASLDHPNIVSVSDLIRVDDNVALVLEHVAGGTLSERLKEGQLPPDLAIDLFRQIVAGVSAAHEVGVVHRDLKPSNVLLQNKDGRLLAKVSDFGIAKHSGSDVTATRAMIGTPRYMAPEQMRSARRVDARADMFALGCILFELVCGTSPFEIEDLLDLYAAKTAGTYADPVVLNPELDERVVTAIHGCLAGTPDRRVPDCAALVGILEGDAWAPAGDDATLDLVSDIHLCPTCGAANTDDTCSSCGGDTLINGRYHLIDVLGGAGGTKVWRGVDLEAGRWVVLRGMESNASDGALVRFERGVRVLSELDHPQIAKSLAPSHTEAGRVWEIREYIEGQSLAAELLHRRMSEVEVLGVVLDLTSVLSWLHRRTPAVIHRNLVPENVIRAEDGRLALVDFARVRDVPNDPDLGGMTFTGNFGAMAPEQFRGDASPASDVFGLGALAVRLLTRKPLEEMATQDGLRWKEYTNVSERTATFIDELMCVNPAHRPDMREVGRRVVRLLADPSEVEAEIAAGAAGADDAMLVRTLLVTGLISSMLLGISLFEALPAMWDTSQATVFVAQGRAPGFSPWEIGWYPALLSIPTLFVGGHTVGFNGRGSWIRNGLFVGLGSALLAFPLALTPGASIFVTGMGVEGFAALFQLTATAVPFFALTLAAFGAISCLGAALGARQSGRSNTGAPLQRRLHYALWSSIQFGALLGGYSGYLGASEMLQRVDRIVQYAGAEAALQTVMTTTLVGFTAASVIGVFGVWRTIFADLSDPARDHRLRALGMGGASAVAIAVQALAPWEPMFLAIFLAQVLAVVGAAFWHRRTRSLEPMPVDPPLDLPTTLSLSAVAGVAYAGVTMGLSGFLQFVTRMGMGDTLDVAAQAAHSFQGAWILTGGMIAFMFVPVAALGMGVVAIENARHTALSEGRRGPIFVMVAIVLGVVFFGVGSSPLGTAVSALVIILAGMWLWHQLPAMR